MPNYIDRDAFLADLEETYVHKTGDTCEGNAIKHLHAMCYRTIKEKIEKSPPVDAVEVVRCGTCRHFELEFDGVGVCHYAGCHLDHAITGFCSYGERIWTDEK